MPFPKVECRGCSLEHEGQGFCKPQIEPEGYGVALCGEALGAEEIAAGGLPFQGKAGAVLTRLIERTLDPLTNTPLERDKFSIINAVSCRPPDNELAGTPWELDALQHCKPIFSQALSKAKPKAILAMGRTALYQLTTLGRAKNSGIEYWRGSVLPSQYGWVIPTFHPSYIMRGNFRFAQVFMADLLRALDVARNGPQPDTHTYLKDPPIEAFKRFVQEWRAAGKPPMGFDIETNYSGGEDETELDEIHLEETKSYEVTRLGLCWKEGYAASVPWIEPYISEAKAVFLAAPETTVWFEEFDVPRLIASGCTFTGKVYDAMKAYHLRIPSLPYNLQAASSLIVGSSYRAWKNEASNDMAWYNARDADYLLRCFNSTRTKLVQDGKWDTFLRHFVEVGRILRKMSKWGVKVDSLKRRESREKFAKELETVRTEVQPLIPLDLKPKKVYKISEAQLRKKFGSELDTPLWTTLEVELTASEQKKLEEKSLKALQKQRDKEQKAQAKREKAESLRLLRAFAKSTGRKRGGRKSAPSGASSPGPQDPLGTPAATSPSSSGEES